MGDSRWQHPTDVVYGLLRSSRRCARTRVGLGPGLYHAGYLFAAVTDMAKRRGKATLKLSQRYVWSLVVGCLEPRRHMGDLLCGGGLDDEVDDRDVTFVRLRSRRHCPGGCGPGT